jgi:signal transduction histidine kinase
LDFNRSEKVIRNVYDFLIEYPHHFENLKKVLSEHVVNDVLVDKKNNVIHVVTNNGYFTYTLKFFSQKKMVLPGSIKCIVTDGDRIFVGTESEGLYIFDLTSQLQIGRYTSIKTQTNTIGGNYIISLYIDHQKNLWCGLVGDGISYCNLNKKIGKTIFTSGSAHENKINSHNFVAFKEFTNGELWTADINGHIRILNQKYDIIQSITPSQIDKSQQHIFIQEFFETKDGQKYLLTDKGVYISDNLRFYKITKPYLKENQKYGQGMVELNDTLGLIATRDGMLYYHLKKKEIIDKPCPIELGSNIYSMFKGEDNYLYINPFFNGLVVYRYEQGKIIFKYKIKKDFNIHDRFEQKDSTILATTKGIVIINTKNLQYSFIDESNGLPNQNLYSVLPDNTEKGSVWCSSNRGIFKYNYVHKTIDAFGLNDGINALEFNSQAMATRQNGDYVFGSTDGITIIQPEEKVSQKKNSNILLYNFRIHNHTPVTYYDSSLQSYKIPFHENDVSFSLININFPNSNSTIHYRISGVDKKYFESKNPANIRYSDLPIGAYTLEARLPGPDDSWQVLTKIVILAPWYRMWWAYILFFLIAGGIISFIVRLYVKNKLERQKAFIENQKAIEKERYRISSDLHDDIGSTLSSISVYSELADKYYYSFPEKSRVMVQKISVQTQNLMERMSDIIWSLKTLNHEKNPIKSKIQDHCGMLLNPKNIDYEIAVDDEVDLYLTEPGLRKNLLLIVKEAIHNIAKHSKADYARIAITLNGHYIIVVIMDNGLGIFQYDAKEGNGFSNMKKRAEDLKASFNIESDSDAGTIIRCVIPTGKISPAQY